MKRKFCLLLAATVCISMLSGCGADRGAEKNMENSAEEETEANDAQEETKEAPPLEMEKAEPIETEEAEDDGADTPEGAYAEILDMFYYKILEGWDGTEDVSYMFYWDYTSVKGLSDAGYSLLDLDGNGVPELLVSTAVDAEYGTIYDLYTYADGEVIHAATGGERFSYSLCEDGTIYYWQSSGAGNSTQIDYSIDADTGLLHPEEVLVYDWDGHRDSPWFYGKGDCYSETDGPDFEKMSVITEEEAGDICDRFQMKAINLTLFDGYTPQGDMPVESRLNQGFRLEIGSETPLFFSCDDFDGDGIKEAFGATGTDDGCDLRDVKLYYVSPDGAVSCIDTFSVIYGFGGISPAMSWNPVMDAGEAKFLNIGGACGQETWLYGVKGEEAYQPEASGQHADFRKAEDGRFAAQPHEGGEGYYLIFYEYDPESGEFVINETAVSAGSTESGETDSDPVNPNTENVASEPSCEHDWVRKEELVSQEMGDNKQSTVVRWYSECRKCGAIRNY